MNVKTELQKGRGPFCNFFNYLYILSNNYEKFDKLLQYIDVANWFSTWYCGVKLEKKILLRCNCPIYFSDLSKTIVFLKILRKIQHCLATFQAE